MTFLNGPEYELSLESDAAVGRIDPGGADRVLFSTKRLGVRTKRLFVRDAGVAAGGGVEIALEMITFSTSGGVSAGAGGNVRSCKSDMEGHTG